MSVNEFHPLHRFFLGSLRRRLIWGVAMVHMVMMTLFILDLSMRQRVMLVDRMLEEAVASAQSLAISTAGWIATNDISGLQEIVEAQRRYPELLFAMVVDRQGFVLAHTDPAYQGLYLLDLPSEVKQTMMSKTSTLVDVAVPAFLGNQHVGWVRVGIGQKISAEKLAEITKNGVIYAVMAILVGSLIAWQMGRRITRRLYAVQETIDAVRSGNSASRSRVSGCDEAAIMAREFNAMLDVLAERDAALRSSITELKAAEDKIGELNRDLEQRVIERTAQLEAANKELEAFSYSVSHDLRTPLRAIDGFSHILLEDYSDKLDDEGKRLLNVVRDNTNRMGQLIDDILNFSRTGRVGLTFTHIDMQGLVYEIFKELQPSPDSQKLILEVEPSLPSMFGDRTMMRQVFVNLLSNAIKFSLSKPIAIIHVGSSILGEEVVYFVKDNGVGFDNRYVGKLFGMFQRLHSVNEFEGTGIGLAIVKRIIARHGGRVWAEGQLGEGASVYFAIPIEERQHG